MSRTEWKPPFPVWKQWVARVGLIIPNPWAWMSWGRWRRGESTEPTFALAWGTMMLIAVGIGLAAVLVGLD